MYIQYHWMPYHRKGYSVLTIKDLSITRGQGEQSFTVSYRIYLWLKVRSFHFVVRAVVEKARYWK